jgi:hypothetical protein
MVSELQNAVQAAASIALHPLRRDIAQGWSTSAGDGIPKPWNSLSNGPAQFASGQYD